MWVAARQKLLLMFPPWIYHALSHVETSTSESNNSNDDNNKSLTVVLWFKIGTGWQESIDNSVYDFQSSCQIRDLVETHDIGVFGNNGTGEKIPLKIDFVDHANEL